MKSQSRVVLAQDIAIEYQLTYKKVKNLNLRVSATGEVRVSAPHRTPAEAVDVFVRSRADWIRRAAARPHSVLADGALVPVLGEETRLRIVTGKRAEPTFSGGELTLYVRDESEAPKAYADWQKSFCVPLLTACTREIFDRMGLPQSRFPILRFRSMTSRWGSCNKAKGIITFNTRLSEKPYRLMEYVVAHELCHLLRADHSAEFYALLERYLPDHAVRRKEFR